ncbi:CRISPR-associated endonuclease Cas2 [Porifericola rhodea]|uniref:CRISPR-associated endonuclease Cas2 n=1 Tax=Porifericola rhodea TaxID=930972 RepID=UPI00266561EB|nr:CRISPR-associated endonuclease Cas2 [Porifericola rhodea]WKN29545.1 CRISPR-associated endonuclease Cas2 [Porifericola rhodea]
MIAWVMYDIQENKPRTKVAKLCKQAGLYRVQKSVFLGTLTAHEKDTLELQIEEEIDEDTDSVYIFPMSKKELRETVLIGQAFDKKLVTDEVRELFY